MQQPRASALPTAHDMVASGRCPLHAEPPSRPTGWSPSLPHKRQGAITTWGTRGIVARGNRGADGPDSFSGWIKEKLWQKETRVFLHCTCCRLTALSAICSVHGDNATSVPTLNSWQRRGTRRETRREPAEFTLEIIDSPGDNSTERARAGPGLEITATSFLGLHHLRFPPRSP